MAPASRDLQENDIDVYVRLDSLATIVKKVSLKNMIIEKTVWWSENILFSLIHELKNYVF